MKRKIEFEIQTSKCGKYCLDECRYYDDGYCIMFFDEGVEWFKDKPERLKQCIDAEKK